MLMLVLAVLIISIASSTKEQRADAREWMKPIGRKLIIPLIVIWGFILLWPSGP